MKHEQFVIIGLILIIVILSIVIILQMLPDLPTEVPPLPQKKNKKFKGTIQPQYDFYFWLPGFPKIEEA